MSKRKITLSILGVVVLAAALFVGIPLARRWNQPLAEGLQLPTLTAIPPNPGLVDASSTAESVNASTLTLPAPSSGADTPQPSSSPTVQPSSTATSAPLCGGPASMIVLALGIDTRADNYLYGLADVIKIVRVDFVTPKVSIISLPRDLWVDIPGIAEHGVTQGKLNQAYFYGTEGMGYYDGPGGAPGLLARTLLDNFGLAADHYGTVNMRTFVRMVDAVGGVDVYLERDVDGRPVDDKTEDMGYFYAGVNHFTGDAALRFSRIRKTDSIFDRMDRQKIVLCALKDKLLQPAVLPKIPELISTFQGSVVTDLSPAQMAQLACLLPKLSGENIIFGGIPEEEFSMSSQYDPRLGNTTFVWSIDYDLVHDYMTQFLAGTWPVSSGEDSSCPPPVNSGQ
jgi:LCP family protein required for cell wall assembly